MTLEEIQDLAFKLFGNLFLIFNPPCFVLSLFSRSLFWMYLYPLYHIYSPANALYCYVCRVQRKSFLQLTIFGQAEASIYQPRCHFNQTQKLFVLMLFKVLIKHHFPVGQVKNRIHYSLLAKSTSPGLSDTTFFARCVWYFSCHQTVLHVHQFLSPKESFLIQRENVSNFLIIDVC